MTHDEAWALLNEYTKNESLIRHALSVEAAMRHYAELLGGDLDEWGLVGLLHDFDYERWPNPPDHTREGAKVLRERGVEEEVIGCILSHADWNLDEYPRDTPMRKALFAVDELAGFIVAVALIRPDKLEGMKVSSVKKKLKAKSFAAAVKREDISAGAELLDVTLEEHIAHCITALQGIKGDLGLT